jgi:hypothetical protein
VAVHMPDEAMTAGAEFALAAQDHDKGCQDIGY